MSVALRSKLWLVAPLCLFALTSAQAAIKDKVVQKDGKEPPQGRVIKDGLTEIEIQAAGGSMKIASDKVDYIEWDIYQQDWEDGLRAMKAGKWTDAAGSFQYIIGEKRLLDAFRPEAQPYLYYLAAHCLHMAGRQDDAMKCFEEYIGKFADSRYIPQAYDGLVDAAIQTSNYRKAQGVLPKLRELGSEFGAKATFYEGRLLLAQKKTAEASQKFTQAIGSTTNIETKAISQLYLARCSILGNDLAKAKKMAAEALTGSTSPTVCAHAHLILGNVLLEEATKDTGDPAKEKYYDAALEFLRIWLMYGGDQDSEPEALFKAGECFAAISKFPNERKNNQRRAVMLYGDVIRRFPGTTWAKDAQANMKKVR